MPIEVGIWRLGETVRRVSFTGMDREKRLEDVLAHDIGVADPGWMLIGRQVLTKYGKFVDLLAIDAEGSLIVLELKKDRTPREVVAQLLDYGSWVRGLERDAIEGIFAEYCAKQFNGAGPRSLDEAFQAKFGDAVPDALNQSHKLVLVASELDDSSERIITYLAEEYGVSINAVFFRVFRDDEREYLSRAWLADPVKVEQDVAAKRARLLWNGEIYVSYAGPNRDWEEARKHGFVSAGGGAWYSGTLRELDPGDRIWVNVPGSGYVGVGRVKESAVPVDEFLLDRGDGELVPITTLPLQAARHTTVADDPERAEYLVRVEWIATVPLAQAVKEKGFFGSQHSAARPRTPRWTQTIERLKQRFGIADEA